VSLLRSIGIAARLVNGHLYANFPTWNWPWEPHAWAEAYVNSNWINIDPALGIYDTDEPFEEYVDLPWCNSVRAAAMNGTDCLEWAPWTPPWYLFCYNEHWEDVSSKYNPPSEETTGTFVILEEEGNFLGLDLYDSFGRHTAVNYEANVTVIDIPGAYYFIGYNFSFIYLPENVTLFDVIVDATYAEEPVETYNMTVFLAVNSTIIDQSSHQSIINAKDTEGYHAQIVNETLEVTPGIHSITVTDCVSSKTIISQGYNAAINISIQNRGDFTEAFNITLYANTTIIAMFENVTLTSGNSTTLKFAWNTTGVAKGNHTITAEATKLPGETDTLDNTLTDGWIIVAMIGDITGRTANPYDFVPDGVIDGADLFPVTRGFGSYPGAPPEMMWHPNADVNGDRVIDGDDIFPIKRHYGEADP